MGEMLRKAVESRKKFIIHALLKNGRYEKDDKQLYQLCLSDLEREYCHANEEKIGYSKENF
ncbi:Fur-regulated basic protein FbpA [Metabacillus sp. SLBN-84]